MFIAMADKTFLSVPSTSAPSILCQACRQFQWLTTITMLDKQKTLSHGFSKKALWEQEEIIQGFVNKLMNNSHGFTASGETFNIVKWYNFITFDVFGDLSFGQSFGCLDAALFTSGSL